MLPMSWLQKFEEQLLGRVDEYCDRQLARRLGPQDAGGLDLEIARLSQAVTALAERLPDSERNRD